MAGVRSKSEAWCAACTILCRCPLPPPPPRVSAHREGCNDDSHVRGALYQRDGPLRYLVSDGIDLLIRQLQGVKGLHNQGAGGIGS